MVNVVTRRGPLAGRLDGLFNEFLLPVAAWDGLAAPAPIRLDVRESPQAYTVVAELAGVKKDDIAIEIEGDQVTLGAEVKRKAEVHEGERTLRAERFYGKSERRLVLPQEVDADKAEARFADGVLELTLPKKQAAATRKIQVQ